MRKIWDKIVALLVGIPLDKWLHFIFGALIAECCILTFHLPAWAGAAVAFGFGLLKEGFDAVTTHVTEWKDAAATSIGALTALVFWALGLLF